MSDLDLETLYSCSKWSKRLSADVICENHINLTRRYSKETEKSIACELNRRYGKGEREVFDIFGTDLEDGTPILIFVHGGYWQREDVKHNNYTYLSNIMHKNKIKSVFIGYELCPKVKLNDIERNIEIAITQCLQYAKDTKARSIHLAGHSAGAQLIANLFEKYIPSLTESDQALFKSAFLLAGVYDLTGLLETSYNIPLKLDLADAMRASTMFKKITGKITFFVVTAEHDSPALVAQGEKLTEYFKTLNLNTKYLLIKNVDHFDLIEKLIDETYELSTIMIRTILLQC